MFVRLRSAHCILVDAEQLNSFSSQTVAKDLSVMLTDANYVPFSWFEQRYIHSHAFNAVSGRQKHLFGCLMCLCESISDLFPRNVIHALFHFLYGFSCKFDEDFDMFIS